MIDMYMLYAIIIYQLGGEMQSYEASLSDYLSIAWKRRRFILLIFGAAIVTSTIVSLLSKPFYEVSTTFEIGRVEDRLVMDKAATRELLTGNQLLQDTIKSLNLDLSLYELRRMIKVEDLPDSTYLLKFFVRGDSPRELMEITQTLSSLVLEKHQEIFDRMMAILQEAAEAKAAEAKAAEAKAAAAATEEERKIRKELLEDRIEAAKLNIKEAKEELEYSPQEEHTSAILKINDAESQLFALEGEYLALANPKKEKETGSLPKPSFKHTPQPSRIFDPAVKPSRPVKEPRIALNILLAGIAGLMAGVILVLLGEKS